jgi:2-oxoglutarate dehydrogenase E2 component (dihydrolipoamide succinyltransferase)
MFRFDKKVGDAVAADEVVMEIETDKTTVGVPSPGDLFTHFLLSFL